MNHSVPTSPMRICITQSDIANDAFAAIANTIVSRVFLENSDDENPIRNTPAAVIAEASTRFGSSGLPVRSVMKNATNTTFTPRSGTCIVTSPSLIDKRRESCARKYSAPHSAGYAKSRTGGMGGANGSAARSIAAAAAFVMKNMRITPAPPSMARFVHIAANV